MLLLQGRPEVVGEGEAPAVLCQVRLLPTDPTYVGSVPMEYGSRPVTVADRALLQAIMSTGVSLQLQPRVPMSSYNPRRVI